jgi:hypothetical protein
MKAHLAQLSLIALSLFAQACAGKAASSDSGESGGQDSGVAGATSRLPAPSSHRDRGSSCAPSPVGPEPGIPNAGAAGAGAFACTTNEACSQRAGGRCVYNTGACGEPCVATAPNSACVYDACAVDTDCPGGSVCICGQGGPVANECSPVGNCRVDADCPSGYCSPSVDGCGGFNGYFCHTAKDECNDDSDCVNSGLFAKCVVDPSSAAWKCAPVGCASAGAN